MTMTQMYEIGARQAAAERLLKALREQMDVMAEDFIILSDADLSTAESIFGRMVTAIYFANFALEVRFDKKRFDRFYTNAKRIQARIEADWLDLFPDG